MLCNCTQCVHVDTGIYVHVHVHVNINIQLCYLANFYCVYRRVYMVTMVFLVFTGQSFNFASIHVN